jgi:translation initiation factor IF-3
LILINEKQNPIVVKLGNYGFFIYQKQKKERKLHRGKKENKEVRISFKEAAYDLKRKAEMVKNFLADGHQVQIRLILKGRERNFDDLAEEKMRNFLSMIQEITSFRLVQDIKKVSNFLLVILAPGH